MLSHLSRTSKQICQQALSRGFINPTRTYTSQVFVPNPNLPKENARNLILSLQEPIKTVFRQLQEVEVDKRHEVFYQQVGELARIAIDALAKNPNQFDFRELTNNTNLSVAAREMYDLVDLSDKSFQISFGKDNEIQHVHPRLLLWKGSSPAHEHVPTATQEGHMRCIAIAITDKQHNYSFETDPNCGEVTGLSDDGKTKLAPVGEVFYDKTLPDNVVYVHGWTVPPKDHEKVVGYKGVAFNFYDAKPGTSVAARLYGDRNGIYETARELFEAKGKVK